MKGAYYSGFPVLQRLVFLPVSFLVSMCKMTKHIREVVLLMLRVGRFSRSLSCDVSIFVFMLA